MIGMSTNNNTNSNLPELKITSFSGSFSATKNLICYEYGDDIIVVDCGIGFPEKSMHGVDLIIPDFTYLRQNKDKIKALFITHSHEDHLGAISYFLEEFNVPMYSNRLVQEYTKEKMIDRGLKGLLKNTTFKTFVPEDKPVIVGPFKVSGFRVNHSVPSAIAYVIDTPQGRIVHAADYKFDMDPVLDKPADVKVIKKIGEEGVLCMLSDCLGVSKDGGSVPESVLGPTFISAQVAINSLWLITPYFRHNFSTDSNTSLVNLSINILPPFISDKALIDDTLSSSSLITLTSCSFSSLLGIF